MTTLREAAQQALEALENSRPVAFEDEEAVKLVRAHQGAITALRAALEEPVQEPVAYSVGRTLHWHQGKGVSNTQLYLAPPQRKPLAEEEIARLVSNDMVKFARAIERAHGIK